ncbi:hypothetical protein FEM48_Zijuj10G0132800 [Ziziphus jujuba var. spinosa]|uniref:Uncharacterized protein n=1 Tax=Ziziphus jujuba var. spinosa TaxID=714518 RepID=A0A978UNL2_ZIZJJ|nr:hypothetical protein FEM48_Zijuj10G0132800 [Ziziphus jujuba var. spinosa]
MNFELNWMLADPSFLYKLLLEQATTIGCSVWWEFKNRKCRYHAMLLLFGRLLLVVHMTAELCMAGLTAGAVQGSLSNYLASYLCRYQAQALMHLVMVAVLGLYANVRYQLLCGYDRAMSNHVDVIRGSLFFSIALKVISEFIYRTLKRIAITRCYLGSPNMKRRIDNHQPSLNGEHNRPPV